MNQSDYIRKLETTNQVTRIRNGELYSRLAAIDPDSAAQVTPINDWPSQYVVLENIINIAHSIDTAPYQTTDDLSFRELLESLAAAFYSHNEYWTQVANEKQKRINNAAKARATRTAKESELGASA